MTARPFEMVLPETIDALLPQTQCGECGYPGCLPYAQALAVGLAPIDRCPPGGVDTVQALAALLNVDAAPYLSGAAANTRTAATYIIREDECIGCTKCIQACPVDAIVGSAKKMHTILQYECTGCGLCVDPCPVDCIEILEQPIPQYDPKIARQRFKARKIRELRSLDQRHLQNSGQDQQQKRLEKQDYILQALHRSMHKKV